MIFKKKPKGSITCENCEFFYENKYRSIHGAPIRKALCAHPSVKKPWKTPVKSGFYGGDCWKLNKNNDCELFKQDPKNGWRQ